MRYEKDFRNLQLEEDTVLTIGKFDGLHKGHDYLMEHVLRQQRKNPDCKIAIFTFNIPPRTLVDGSISSVLHTNEEKRERFKLWGVDYFIECPFDREIMCMEAEEFLRQIATRLRVRALVVGDDFHFGYRRRGDHRMLLERAGLYGYELEVVKKKQHDGRDISSSYIREEISKGNMELATELLGIPYSVQGTVVHGKELGRTIGFPTINLIPQKEKLLPPFGVYVSTVVLDGDCYAGITNIGRKPTVGTGNAVGIETYVYNFDKMVYEHKAKVYLHHFIRPERQFDSVESLAAQLKEDILHGTQYLQGSRDCSVN